MKNRLCIAVVALMVFSLSAYADEELTKPGFGVSWGATGTEDSWMDDFNHTEVTDNGDGTFTVTSNWSVTDICTIDLDMTYKLDPYVIGGFSVTNNATYDQSFTFTFTAPVSPAIATATNYAGSMAGEMTVDEPAGSPDGTVSTVTGKPLYMAQIDGSDFLPLYSDPTSWSSAAGTTFSIPSTNSPLTTDGSGPSVAADIGIVFNLTLTPGETVTMDGTFVVLPVPEPASLAILGLGALLLGVRRK